MNNIAANICFGVLLPVTLVFAGIYFNRGQYHAASWWFFAVLVIAGLGGTLYTQSWLTEREERAAANASRAEREAAEAARRDAELRPYLGVSYVQATLEIGKPISILIKFTNTGKTPAEDAEILTRFQKVPMGAPVDRDFTGNDLDWRSVGSVNVGNTVESEIVGHEWTLDELMQVATDGTHQIFAHGVIRYRSEYIPSGTEETPFCYEFDKASGQMVICRVDTSTNAAAAKISAEVAERALLISQRGWAITSDFTISGFAENSAARISFLIVNAGSIPIKFTGGDTLIRIGVDLPDEPDYGERGAFPDPTGIIGPGQRATLNQDPRVITSAEFTRIVSGEQKLFAFGRIFYTDIFGEHETGYAVVLGPDLRTFLHVPSKPKYTYSA